MQGAWVAVAVCGDQMDKPLEGSSCRAHDKAGRAGPSVVLGGGRRSEDTELPKAPRWENRVRTPA